MGGSHDHTDPSAVTVTDPRGVSRPWHTLVGGLGPLAGVRAARPAVPARRSGARHRVVSRVRAGPVPVDAPTGAAPGTDRWSITTPGGPSEEQTRAYDGCDVRDR